MSDSLGIPVYGFDEVLQAVSPPLAIERVRQAFVRHAKGEWSMPSKVYLDSPPHGDFRAMPALGDGMAILKWVTSFPANPKEGRPVVYGTVLASDARTGEPKAIIDGRAVTALRTGAAAAVAATALARREAETAAIVGCGLHGRWAGL
ncbi:MAG: ornithine cyclodeaminase family protein, partial [Actinomycetota bacterium]